MYLTIFIYNWQKNNHAWFWSFLIVLLVSETIFSKSGFHVEISTLQCSKIATLQLEHEISHRSIFQKFVFRAKLSKNAQVLFWWKLICWSKSARCIRYVWHLWWVQHVLKVKMMSEKNCFFISLKYMFKKLKKDCRFFVYSPRAFKWRLKRLFYSNWREVSRGGNILPPPAFSS